MLFRSLSISQAGYNTVVETLACADRAVLVPFATDRETEQTIRARAVVARGGAQMVEGAALDGPALAAALKSDKPTVIQAPMENAPTPTPGHWNINDIYRKGE